MNWLRYKATPVGYWFGEAFTEFVNGFIDGLGGGIGTGAGTGAITGTTQVGDNLSAVNQVWLSIAAVVAAMIGSGIQAVYVWHKINRFPNPWPRPTGDTTPPTILP